MGLAWGGGDFRLPWQHIGPPHFPESEIELDALLPGERLFKKQGGGMAWGHYPQKPSKGVLDWKCLHLAPSAG